MSPISRPPFPVHWRAPRWAAAAAACSTLVGPALANAVVSAPACDFSTPHTCVMAMPYIHDAYQTTLPAGVDHISVSARGGSSGDGYNDNTVFAGGAGAVVEADLEGVAGHVLYAFPGGAGTVAPEGFMNPGQGGGGWNGGGNAQAVAYPPFAHFGSGGGGGASDVRLGGTTDDDRVLVAGGAGGAGASSYTFPWGVGAACVEPAACESNGDSAEGGLGAYNINIGAAGGGGGGGYRGGRGGNIAEPAPGGSSWVDPAHLVEGTATYTAGANGDTSPPSEDGQVEVSYSLVPHAPTDVVARATGTTAAEVTWTPPAHTGGLAVTYVASASGGRSCTTATTSCRIEGLTPSTAYAVTVISRNSDSDSLASMSASVTTQPLPVTGAGSSSAPGTNAGGGTTAVTPRLAVRTRVRGRSVVSTGSLARGASAVRQQAVSSAGRTVTGGCAVPRRAKGKATYRCTANLPGKGRWVLTTQAVAGSTVVAESTSTINVKR